MIPTTVAILEDELVLRESLDQLLTEAGVKVLFSSGDARDFLNHLRFSPPNVALIDLKLESDKEVGPGSVEIGLEVIADVRRSLPDVRLLVLSSTRDSETVERCLAAGASGYLFKHAARRATVVDAVRAVANGERMVPVMRLPLATAGSSVAEPRVALSGVTSRESVVLQFVTSGADNLKISAHMGITERTVKAHLASLYRKLSCDNRTQLALRARELGVAPLRNS